MLLVSVSVHFLIVISVFPADNSLPPLAVIKVPLNRFLDSVLKLSLRQPTKLCVDFGRVNGVAHIVPLAVGDVGDEALRFAKFFANQFNYVNVSHLVMPTNVVDLSYTSFVNNKVNRLAVILDIKPIADVFAFAVNWQRLVIQAVCNHQWDKLLGKVIGSVIVGAAGDGYRQPVCAVICEHEQIGGRF